MENFKESVDGRERSGKARMAKLTAEQRRQLGKQAAAKRWSVPQKPVMGPYTPDAWGDLPIIGHIVPCAVIMIDGEPIRVVSERELVKSLGGKRGGSHWLRARESAEAANLPPVLSASNLRDFISDELREGLATRYPYKVPGRSGFVANGLRGELGLSPWVRQTVKALLTVRWNCIVPRKPFLAR